MRYSNEGSFRRQFDFLRRQFVQDGELSFTDALSRETVNQALDTIEDVWNDRIYTPLITLWVFLGQVLRADHSCRNAVARLIVHRVSRGLNPCSSKTSAYGGGILHAFGMALSLGSLWALIPAGFASTVLIVRTKWEDQALQEELNGFKEYAIRVRYKLIPGVW